jgi:N-methylhydantoinase A
VYRIGVDIGGTFTDFALFDARGAKMSVHKRLTTPHDPSEAVTEGIDALLKREGVAIADISDVVHGTTLVTNAVIERTGAVTGMLATAGFSDILDMGFERRYDLFDLRVKYPPPLVPRRLRLEVAERVRFDGSVETPLDEAAVQSAAKRFKELGVAAVAVCFLHAYANPAHEARATQILRDAAPDLFVSASADVFPNMREFERWTTTTVNAFTQPMFDRYLERLEKGLASRGFRGRLYIMASSGGTLTADTARRFPVRALESGPAAGVLMSAYHGRSLDLTNLLSFDMGGTTAKGALVRGGTPIKRYSMEVARVHEFRRGSGLAIRIPAIDMIEIGAGGGSIAEIDDRGLLRVGPRSAGADPGPACYGRGGTRPTLTDANLVLGYLDAGFFLGGAMGLDRAAAEGAIRDAVAKPLGLEALRAAWGINDIVSEDVARAFRIHASERGFDYRSGSMVAFGGSGPLHALAIARKLKIPRVVFPVGAGVMSALGLLISPLAFEMARSRRIHVADIDAADFAATFAALETEATSYLLSAGVAKGDIRVKRRLDMRYQGQGHEIEVALPDGADAGALFADLGELFDRAYEAAYTLRLDEPAEIVNWKVEAAGPAPNLGAEYNLSGPAGTAKALKGARLAYDSEVGRMTEWPVYDRYALLPGATVKGPALIEERESTCVIGADQIATVDAHYNLVANLNG